MRVSNLDSAVAVARALGHPARLRVIAMLDSGELCVCQIIEVLELAPSTVSAHLKELKQAGLTVERKYGRWVHVGLTTDGGARSVIEALLASLVDDPQLVADAQLVNELRSFPVEDLCRLGFRRAETGLSENAQARTSHRVSSGGR
ncbi:MAG: ArsR/SmtB family transcription factor [Thermoanaerobaculales bacterium]